MWRSFLILLLCIGVVGFGLCSVSVGAAALTGRDVLAIALTALNTVLALACLQGIRWLVRWNGDEAPSPSDTNRRPPAPPSV